MVDDPSTFSNVDGITELAVEIRRFIHVNVFCVVWEPIEDVEPAPDIVGARPTDPEHVDDLVVGFRNTFDVNDRGMLLILNTEVWERVHSSDGVGQTWQQVKAYCKEHGIAIWIIGGTHTNKALRKCKDQFPENQLWWLQKFKVLVCKDEPEVRQLLRDQGNIMNMKHIGKKTTFAEVVVQMHNNAVAEGRAHLRAQGKKFDATTITPTDCPAPVVKIMKDRLGETAGGFSTQTIGAYWQLSKRGGRMWDIIHDLIMKKRGKGTGKAQKPYGAGVFSGMGKVPEEELIKWLELLHEGGITDKEFKQKCNDYKAREATKLVIMKLVQGCEMRMPNELPKGDVKTFHAIDLDAAEEHEAAWALIKKIHPILWATKFVEQWLFSTGGDKKKTDTSINQHLVQAVENVWAEDTRVANRQVTPHTMPACIVLACVIIQQELKS
jgi:hypothetical protein